LNISITVKSSEAKLELGNIQKKMSNLRPFFINFQTYMQSVTGNTFKRLKKGGTFRGVTWNPFAPQYIRKDGTVVPAEGGIQKVRGEGMVKGRLRGEEGKSDAYRVKSTSNLLRNTATLQNSALNKISKTKTKMIMDTGGKAAKYAGWQNQIRPFQFFEIPKDEKVAQRMLEKYIN
jgi:hypothetical protein